MAFPESLLDRLAPVRQLGRGGMGEVWLARHARLDELRVVKVIRGGFSGDEDFRARFLREAKLASQLRSPNLVSLFDYSVDPEGTAIIEMEYVHGVDLERVGREARFRALGTVFLVELLAQLLDAIAVLHRRGVVHRDVAPDNALLTLGTDEKPLVKLIDLGISIDTSSERLTQSGSFVGKIRYIAPEGLQGLTPTPATDIYSFGVVAYELLTGNYPYDGVSEGAPSAYAYAHLQNPVRPWEEVDPRDTVPQALRDLLERCLEKRPEARPSTSHVRTELVEATKELPAYSLPDFQATIQASTEAAVPAPASRPLPADPDSATGIGTLPGDLPPELGRSGMGNPWRAPAVSTIAPTQITKLQRPRTLPERYTILDELGRSPRGVLFRTWDRFDECHVALKLFATDVGADEEESRRFIRSGREWARLSHENIVKVHDWSPGEEGRQAYIAFEYLDGSALDSIIRKAERPRLQERYAVAVQLARGLAGLHQNGVVHRDIRPSNVFVTRERSVKILESGLAKTHDSQTVVTVLSHFIVGSAYSSPEERGRAADYRSDIYSAALTILELFLGSFEPSERTAEERLSLLRKVEGGARLRATLARALELNPGTRLQTAQELVTSLVEAGLEDLGPAALDRLLPGSRVAARGVVFMLHGIRTAARWQRAFSEVASSRGWSCRTDRWNFGYFSTLKLLYPPARRAKIEWCRKAYQEEMSDREVVLADGELPSVVAHSFGTYILGYALLQYPYLRFDRVILCGSILPVDFPWATILERGQVRRVRNEFGTRDLWTRLVRVGVGDAGPSGTDGFEGHRSEVEQEKFTFSHSEYFDKAHMRARWIPFLERPA